MKILLINAYSVHNIGDGAIVGCMIKLARSVYPHAQIDVMSSYAEQNRPTYDIWNVKSLNSIWDLNQPAKFGRIGQYLRWLKLSAGAMLSGNAASLKAFKDADLVMSVGGGYLHSSRKGPLGLGFLNAAFHIWLAQRAGKPVLLFPQSFGPFYWKLDRMLVRRLMKKVTRAWSREALSSKTLREMNVTNFEECPDVAFSILPEPDPAAPDVSAGSPRIGVTLLDWRYAIPGGDATGLEAYVKRLADTMKGVLASYPGAKFYIFPQVTVTSSYAPNEDIAVSKMLLTMMPEHATMIDTRQCRTPEALAALYQQMDVFIGSRMHSTIFALCASTPTIALAYQPKTAGTFALLGLGDCTMPIDKFQTEQLLEKTLAMLADRPGYVARVRAGVGKLSDEVWAKIGDTLRQSQKQPALQTSAPVAQQLVAAN